MPKATMAQIKASLERVKNDETLDVAERELYITALTDKLKAEERAREQLVKRAKEKLFIHHFVNGCPECTHKYSPSETEVNEYVEMREASSIKL